MFSLDTLPELVILNIFSHLGLSNGDMENVLRYCSINNKLRTLALPLVYRRLVIYGSSGDPPKDKWSSNIGLFTNERLQKLAKSFHIIGNYSTDDFAEELGPLLDTINQCSVGWPSEYGSQLTGEIQSLSFPMDTTYVHQSLDSQLLNRMRHVLEVFAGKFPNIAYMFLAINKSRGTAQQFIEQLLDACSPRIQDLDLYVEFPLDLEYYPPESKRLVFQLSSNTTYPLTKIRNPEILKTWYISRLFNNITWSDLMEVPADSNLVVFSNLKTLSFDFSQSSRIMMPDHLDSAQDLQVQFPRLATLIFRKKTITQEMLFSPQIIPSSLEEVDLEVSLYELVLFQRLLVHSIRRLTVSLDMSDVRDMKEFYQVTNWLLGKINNFRNYTYQCLHGRLEWWLVMECIRWTNVTVLWLASIDVFMLVKLLHKLPLLKSLDVLRLSSNADSTTLLQKKLLLQVFMIGNLVGPERILDTVVEFISSLMKQCPIIKKLRLPNNLKERVAEMVEGIEWQHVELEVS